MGEGILPLSHILVWLCKWPTLPMICGYKTESYATDRGLIWSKWQVVHACEETTYCIYRVYATPYIGYEEPSLISQNALMRLPHVHLFPCLYSSPAGIPPITLHTKRAGGMKNLSSPHSYSLRVTKTPLFHLISTFLSKPSPKQPLIQPFEIFIKHSICFCNLAETAWV